MHNSVYFYSLVCRMDIFRDRAITSNMPFDRDYRNEQLIRDPFITQSLGIKSRPWIFLVLPGLP